MSFNLIHLSLPSPRFSYLDYILTIATIYWVYINRCITYIVERIKWGILWGCRYSPFYKCRNWDSERLWIFCNCRHLTGETRYLWLYNVMRIPILLAKAMKIDKKFLTETNFSGNVFGKESQLFQRICKSWRLCRWH